MKRIALACGVLGLVVANGPGAAAQDKQPAMNKQPAVKMSAIPQTPEWQAIKSLVGNWEGFYEMDGKKVPTAVEVRLTGGGSAVMHVMAKDTPYEMVTMFHPDGDRLLATHYCGAHNQPRMALVRGEAPNQMRFEFVDGTNIKPGDTYMKRLVVTIVDADHHDEAWTSISDGKETPPSVFRYTRKK